MEKIDKLRYKIAEMCLRYSEMENTNNEKGQRLLFDIQKLTESFNLIKEQFDYTSALEFINPIQPIISNNLKSITNKIVEQLKSIPRYDKNAMYGSCFMEENKDGEYVEYEDILKIINGIEDIE